MKRYLLSILLLGAGGLIGFADENATQKNGIHVVKPGPFKIEMSLSGTFAAAKEHPIRLRPQVWTDLTVTRDAIAHGTMVSTNDVLVNLKTDGLQQRIEDGQMALAIAELDLAVAQVEYSFATNNAALDQASAQRAFARLEQDFKRYEEKMHAYSKKSALFSETSARNSLAYAREELEQLKKMYEADDVTEETEEIILTRAQHSVARAELSLERTRLNTEASLQELLPRELEDKREALARLKLTTQKTEDTHEQALQKLKIGLAKQIEALGRAKQSQAKLEADLKLLDVRSPATGRVFYGAFAEGVWGGQKVVKPKLAEGGKLTAGEVFMTVVELRPLLIQGSVGEADFRKVYAGAKGWAIPKAAPAHRVPVTVTAVAQVPSAPGKYNLTLSADLGEKGYLLPGMGCSVKLTLLDEASVITVPTEALHQNADGQPVVKVKDPEGTIVERGVVLGNSHNGRTLIDQGLMEGDEVVLP